MKTFWKPLSIGSSIVNIILLLIALLNFDGNILQQLETITFMNILVAVLFIIPIDWLVGYFAIQLVKELKEVTD